MLNFGAFSWRSSPSLNLISKGLVLDFVAPHLDPVIFLSQAVNTLRSHWEGNICFLTVDLFSLLNGGLVSLVDNGFLGLRAWMPGAIFFLKFLYWLSIWVCITLLAVFCKCPRSFIAFFEITDFITLHLWIFIISSGTLIFLGVARTLWTSVGISHCGVFALGWACGPVTEVLWARHVALWLRL